MIDVVRYNFEYKNIWNEFNANAKNSLFMFDRDYMDYHSDRFCDYSLMLFSDDELIALFPACIIDRTIKSHGGLTYGGFIVDDKIKQTVMNDCMNLICEYYKSNGLDSIVYKEIPHIYHLQPAEEDRFALFINGFNICNIDVSTAINLEHPIKMRKGRKAQISKAKREGVTVREISDNESIECFMSLEDSVLLQRHNLHAVHSSSEIILLHDLFPDNIRIFCAFYEGKMIAGTMVYVYQNAIHTQYMAANDIARDLGALDLVISEIIEQFKKCKKWLDFGISTEHGKVFLNEGLVSQKEGFGGRTVVYNCWEKKLTN